MGMTAGTDDAWDLYAKIDHLTMIDICKPALIRSMWSALSKSITGRASLQFGSEVAREFRK